MPATIRDVAERAGVSTATVSRVLHGSPLVSKQTQESVAQAMRDLNYSPSAIARGLVTRRTAAVGLVITTIADPFFADIVRGVEEIALRRNMSVILCNSNNDPDHELAVVRLLQEHRTDGIIIASSRVGSLYHSALQQVKVPLVLINSQQSGDYTYSLATDDVAGSRAAAAHLIGLGHRRIAYIHGPLTNSATQQREHGYRLALAEQGLAGAAIIAHGDGRPAGGQAAMTQLLASPEPPQAVFCYNDLTAVGAMQAVRAAGLAVPADVSIMGYDDIDLAAYLDPPLTTMAQQKLELGRRAMSLVLDLLDGKPVHSPSVLAALLVERASCRRAHGVSVPYSSSVTQSES